MKLIHMNPIPVYHACGRACGEGRSHHDQGMVSFQQDWFNRAIRLETDPEHIRNAREAFNSGYKEGVLTT